MQGAALIDVVTVFAPRPQHPKWREYVELLRLQKRSVQLFGHRHCVVTDGDMPGFETLRVYLPPSLNHALIGGQIAALEAWSGEHPLVLVDADCLVCRKLDGAFDGSFEIGLTSRENPIAPIQNGVMYFAPGGKPAAIELFNRARELCKEHWGGDQEAISQAVAPVPREHCVETRFGARLSFLSTKTHNWSPKKVPDQIREDRYVVHLKGDRKELAEPFWKLIRGA